MIRPPRSLTSSWNMCLAIFFIFFLSCAWQSFLFSFFWINLMVVSSKFWRTVLGNVSIFPLTWCLFHPSFDLFEKIPSFYVKMQMFFGGYKMGFQRFRSGLRIMNNDRWPWKLLSHQRKFLCLQFYQVAWFPGKFTIIYGSEFWFH